MLRVKSNPSSTPHTSSELLDCVHVTVIHPESLGPNSVSFHNKDQVTRALPHATEQPDHNKELYSKYVQEKSLDFDAKLTKSQCSHFRAVQPARGLICKMGIIRVLASEDFCEDEVT